jgi:hypothetical protein
MDKNASVREERQLQNIDKNSAILFRKYFSYSNGED